MSDIISKRYNQILRNLNLDEWLMSDYDLLDMISFIVEIEKAFNIRIDDDKADELFKLGSHEAWIEYIRTLL